jgi:hypothetical protein
VQWLLCTAYVEASKGLSQKPAMDGMHVLLEKRLPKPRCRTMTTFQGARMLALSVHVNIFLTEPESPLLFGPSHATYSI